MKVRAHVAAGLIGTAVTFFIAFVLARELGKGAPASRLAGLALAMMGISLSSASQLSSAEYKRRRLYRVGFLIFSVGFALVIASRG